MKFDKIEQRGGAESEGGTFLKVSPGASVAGVLRGEVHKFWSVWPQGGKKQEFDTPTAGSSVRFKVNFIVWDGTTFVAKVWEFGITINNLLAEITKHMDITKTKINISRTGSGKEDTRYNVIPVGPVGEKQLAQINAVKLNLLGAKPQVLPEPEFDGGFGDPPPFDSDMETNELPL